MSKLTIAQALRRVKIIKGRIAEHRSRAINGVSYELNKQPAFNFSEEMNAMKLAQNELLDLESRIVRANAVTEIQDVYAGNIVVTLAHAIRQLQELKGWIAFLKELELRTGTTRERVSEWDDVKNDFVTFHKEVSHVSELTEKARDELIKNYQDHFEILNNAVEDANHKTQV
jgi:hypothetical protein